MEEKHWFSFKFNLSTPRMGSARVLGIFGALSVGIGCGDEAVEGSFTGEFDVQAEGLERTYEVRLAAVGEESRGMSEAFGLPESALKRIRSKAEIDPSWQSKSGGRFEAMLVLEDGTAFGQRSLAIESPVPSETNGFGGYAGEIGLSERSVILGGDLEDDRRFRTTSLNTLRSYPYRTIGALNNTQLPGWTGCTGTKIGPRAVLTNSHCVLDENGNWTTNGWWHPGQTRTEHPNAGGTAVRWSGVFARDWRIHRKFDYAIIFLEDRANAVSLGWMGVNWWNGASSYNNQLVALRGYPARSSSLDSRKCNASPFASKNCGGWMYSDLAILSSSSFREGGSDDDQLAYDIDTTAGQSGSAVYRVSNNAILGVHWGYFGGASSNFAARFRSSMWNDVCAWIRAVPSQHASHSLCN